jgi:hypothetical protein
MEVRNGAATGRTSVEHLEASHEGGQLLHRARLLHECSDGNKLALQTAAKRRAGLSRFPLFFLGCSRSVFGVLRSVLVWLCMVAVDRANVQT